MRQIIALGGGGFSEEPDNLALDRYILKQAKKDRPKVCFLPTASGDADRYVLKFYQAFAQLECQPSVLSLFRLPAADLEDFVLDKDIIYVGGGNTRSMLALWREWGLDVVLADACKAGVVLAGISAGANCWFQESTTDSVPGTIGVLPGLGILKGSFTPHYDTEKERRPALHRLLLSGKFMPGLAADEGAAAHFIDGKLYSAVSSRPGARVYRVELRDNTVSEEELPVRYICSDTA